MATLNTIPERAGFEVIRVLLTLSGAGPHVDIRGSVAGVTIEGDAVFDGAADGLTLDGIQPYSQDTPTPGSSRIRLRRTAGSFLDWYNGGRTEVRLAVAFSSDSDTVREGVAPLSSVVGVGFWNWEFNSDLGVLNDGATINLVLWLPSADVAGSGRTGVGRATAQPQAQEIIDSDIGGVAFSGIPSALATPAGTPMPELFLLARGAAARVLAQLEVVSVFGAAGLIRPGLLKTTADLLITQWRNQPRIRAIIEIWLEVAQAELIDPLNTMRLYLTLSGAEGVWLGMIGERLGVPRPWSSAASTASAFGFDDAGVGFDQGLLSDPGAIQSRSPIGDRLYRAILYARVVTITTPGTLASMVAAMAHVDPNASVRDNNDMSFTVHTGRRAHIELADRVGALPIPAGVRMEIIDRGAFGFDDAGVGFDQGHILN